MKPDTITAIIVAFFTVLVIGGSVVAVLRSSVLKQNNKDLIERVDILERAKINNEATIKAHEAKISALETTVTGRDLLSQLMELGRTNEERIKQSNEIAQRILDEFILRNRRPHPS
jgi:hypothetical protein